MEFFCKAKSIRLRSHHDKYLSADNNGEHVFQDRQSSTNQSIWTVEFVDAFDTVVRLKSCNGTYLTASEDQHILGVSGRKVVQTKPQKLDSSVEWEPVRDGFQVRLKTRYGNFLRANGGLPPWRNSITHDIPHLHHDWILWEVCVVEVRSEKEAPAPDTVPEEVVLPETESVDLGSGSFLLRTPGSDPFQANDLLDRSSSKIEGRMIYYRVADNDDDDNGDIDGKETLLVFKGHGLDDLTRNLEEQTEMDDIIVCSRNPLNGKLYPLRLALPPNNSTMHIVVVPATSKVARGFLSAST